MTITPFKDRFGSLGRFSFYLKINKIEGNPQGSQTITESDKLLVLFVLSHFLESVSLYRA